MMCGGVYEDELKQGFERNNKQANPKTVPNHESKIFEDIASESEDDKFYYPGSDPQV